MENLTTMLQIVLPAAMVGGIAYFIVYKYLQYEENKLKLEIDKSRLEIVFPARMQAYERITLYLERITPENLVRRVIKGNTSVRVFQSEMIATVRSEYEHNISQQIYISLASWAMVKTATEESIRLVNVAAAKINASAQATDLAEKILEISTQIGKFPTHMAIEHIKKEFAQYFIQANLTNPE